FHDLPKEDPIKHIKDFEVIFATTRRTGGDEDAVKAFALPFSKERQKTGQMSSARKFRELPNYMGKLYTSTMRDSCDYFLRVPVILYRNCCS
ncbi:hypothetical protein PIB30_058393, partial [Stylosanthes scabra]|nr:hypothetical protein [Stylosanthes scabra]